MQTFSNLERTFRFPEVSGDEWIRAKVEARRAFAELRGNISSEEAAKEWEAMQINTDEPIAVDEPAITIDW